jgi:hypothetical protein
MRIRPFGVEQWMSEYETRCDWNLAETCVESLTIAKLLEMAGLAGSILDELLPMKLTYGAIEGSDRLRDSVAALYADQSREKRHGGLPAHRIRQPHRRPPRGTTPPQRLPARCRACRDGI